VISLVQQENKVGVGGQDAREEVNRRMENIT
jgi:hypothetical protein